MKTSVIIVTAILAGIYSAILNQVEEDYGLNHIASIIILILLTIITGYIFSKVTHRNENR